VLTYPFDIVIKLKKIPRFLMNDYSRGHIKCCDLSFTVPATSRSFDSYVDPAYGYEKWNRSHQIPFSLKTGAHNTTSFPACGTVIPWHKIVGERAAFTC
jgi:hypothetical protein